MVGINILEAKEGVIENNDELAERVRKSLNERKIFMVNIMGSPGAGKTSVLKRTVEALRSEYRIAVIEADVDSNVDARAMAATGAKVVQLHTGGLCHLDANMTLEGVRAFDGEDTDLIFIENIGNLVCPAEFDTGAHLKVMILSVPEGDDKPLKYPLMFEKSDCLLVNKTDTAAAFDFDLKLLETRVRDINPDMTIIPLSAVTGEGTEVFTDWLKGRISGERH